MKDKNIGIVSNGVYLIDKIGFAYNVPAFFGGESEGVFAGGDNSFIVCIKNASHGDVFNYVKVLEEKGYSKVFENIIGDNSFYSYSNENNLIYVYYIDALKSVKLIAEPFYAFSYNETVEDIVKPAVITSAACDRNYYIRLPNNELVVIDGGWRVEDRSRYEPQELFYEMYKEMVEICQSEEVKVPLWIITHAHNDHAKVLELLYKMPFANKFTIDRILYNFPDDEHLKEKLQVPNEKIKESKDNIKNWHNRAGIEYPYEDIFYNCPFPIYESMGYENICRTAFKQYNAVNIKAHDGMRFNMSGVVFEVLHTPDDDMPTIYENMNDTSLVIKMTYENSVTLWLGDMGVVPGDSCIEMYGDYLKCDAVQVSHHGWGSASWEFFKLLNPQILLWNNSEFGFQYADKYQGYGKTESSTKLFNMPCVKQNYFCNTIKMQYIDLPFVITEDEKAEKNGNLLVSAASDRTFMLRLQDGRLVMINGGWRNEAWNRYEHNTLMQNLVAEMQAFAKSDVVTVAAWFVTDQKDNQLLQNLNDSDLSKKIKIENIVCASNNRFNTLSENYIIAETDLKLSFGEMDAEILYSDESSALMVIKCCIAGKTIIFTGNMTDCISQEIIKSGKCIKCDIIQIANGGLNNGGVFEFYKNANAKIGLWNTSEYAYRFFNKTEGYEKSEVSTKVYNLEGFEKHYFCDRILPQIV
ncbi:MAG: hypothetical protein J6B22_04205 [Clostridia bacterium]|nr:hypothetical protein [Clostridia bacterium]